MPANAYRFYEQVSDDALHLPREQRSMLIETLQKSLQENNTLSDEWIEAIDNRADEIDSGRVQLLDGDECMKAFDSI